MSARRASRNRVKEESPDVTSAESPDFTSAASPIKLSHESPLRDEYWQEHDSLLKKG